MIKITMDPEKAKLTREKTQKLQKPKEREDKQCCSKINAGKGQRPGKQIGKR